MVFVHSPFVTALLSKGEVWAAKVLTAQQQGFLGASHVCFWEHLMCDLLQCFPSAKQPLKVLSETDPRKKTPIFCWAQCNSQAVLLLLLDRAVPELCRTTDVAQFPETATAGPSTSPGFLHQPLEVGAFSTIAQIMTLYFGIINYPHAFFLSSDSSANLKVVPQVGREIYFG